MAAYTVRVSAPRGAVVTPQDPAGPLAAAERTRRADAPRVVEL